LKLRVLIFLTSGGQVYFAATFCRLLEYWPWDAEQRSSAFASCFKGGIIAPDVIDNFEPAKVTPGRRMLEVASNGIP
jgi:hypothetical protein